MTSVAERFDNILEYIKIFLYNLQRVIFWSRYILLYLIGGIIALDQIRLLMYYHNIFMLLSVALSLVLTAILLPQITSSNYTEMYRNLKNNNKISTWKAIVNSISQYIADVTVAFTLTTHMLMFYWPQIAVALLRTYSPLILLIIAFVFWVIGVFNYHSYNYKAAVNTLLANHPTNQKPLGNRNFNKVHLAISTILSLVVFFGLNKYFFGIALVLYTCSPPTLLAAAIFGLGAIFAWLGFSRNCWHVIQATSMGIATSYTTMLLGKILYLSFYASMVVTTSATNTIVLGLPSIPYTPIFMLLSLVLGVVYGFIYYNDLVAEYKAISLLDTKDVFEKGTFFGSSMDLTNNTVKKNVVEIIKDCSHSYDPLSTSDDADNNHTGKGPDN